MNTLYDREPRLEWTPDHARLFGYTNPDALADLTPGQLDAVHERVRGLADWKKTKPRPVVGC